MANNPRKIKDPTEAALSAIQDALNLRETPSQASARPGEPSIPEPPASARSPSRAPAMDEELFRDSNQLSLPGVPEPGQRRAANDDRQSVGQTLQALQQRPSRTPYVIAALLSVAWAIVTVATHWTAFQADPRLLLTQGATIVLPILFFIAIAYLVVRAQELRL